MAAFQGIAETPPLAASGKIKAVEVHDLGPGGHEVLHECLLRIVGCVDLRERPQL